MFLEFSRAGEIERLPTDFVEWRGSVSSLFLCPEASNYCNSLCINKLQFSRTCTKGHVTVEYSVVTQDYSVVF